MSGVEVLESSYHIIDVCLQNERMNFSYSAIEKDE